PTDNVYNDSSLATISGQRKLFQPAINVKITWTANIGFDNGRISLKKINISLPPSNRAASIRSSGIVVINWRIKNILKAEIKPGKIIPDIVFVKSNIFKTKYVGIIVTWPGIIMVARTKTKSNSRPLNLNFPNP